MLWGLTRYSRSALDIYLYTISLILPESSPEARAAVAPQRRCRGNPHKHTYLPALTKPPDSRTTNDQYLKLAHQ